MIDPHAHLRDWDQADKETVAHGLAVARKAGLDAVFEMPNTSPPLTTRKAIERRLELGRGVARKLGMTHGLYAGLTADPDQVREVVRAHAELYPGVVGLKLYAGHSTGRMGVVELGEQRAVWRCLSDLGYRGVVAVHAEKEALIRPWDPARPSSHATSRPPEAEVESVREQIALAGEHGFRGALHIAHVSVPESLAVVREARAADPGFRITTGVTPHHVLLRAQDMDAPDGVLLKVNPPLRPRALQVELLDSLLGGEIDWIETDHAPHTLADKRERGASGIPVFPFYPRFLAMLRARGVPSERMDALTHGNIERVFGFEIRRSETKVQPEVSPGEYPFDPFECLFREGRRPAVSLIAALDERGLIGSGGGMPWRHREDMRYFRRTTLGKTVIMGRKTYETLAKPLDGRSVVVLTRGTGFRPPQGVVTAGTPEEALARSTGDEVFVAGGAEIYTLFLPMADRLHLTRMAGMHIGDTYFPPVPWSRWRKVWERAGDGCRFERYVRAVGEDTG